MTPPSLFDRLFSYLGAAFVVWTALINLVRRPKRKRIIRLDGIDFDLEE